MDTLPLLGTQLTLRYGSSLSPEDTAWARERLTAACQLVETYASLLSYAQTTAIRQIKSFTVVGSADYLGATGCGGETLSVQYLHSCSVAWLASLFAHEGQHHLNEGLYHGADLWQNEKSAGTTQLETGRQLGMTAGENDYLQHWIADSNQAAMQLHMQQGLKD